MSRFILAAFGALAVAGAASAQQPQSQPPPVAAPAPAPAAPPAAAAPLPPAPVSSPTVIRGTGGCTTCGSNVRGAVQSVTGGNCLYGYGCQNGCGSLKSDLAFHFGSCKYFFAPNGPTCGSLNGHGHCGYQDFAKPFGTGWNCPRQYDTYANH